MSFSSIDYIYIKGDDIGYTCICILIYIHIYVPFWYTVLQPLWMYISIQR